MKLENASENLERIELFSTLYDKLASENPSLPEEVTALRSELKLTKIEMLKLILSLKRSLTDEEETLDV